MVVWDSVISWRTIFICLPYVFMNIHTLLSCTRVYTKYLLCNSCKVKEWFWFSAEAVGAVCVYKHKCTCVEMVTYKILQKAHGKVEFKNKPIFPSPKLNPCCFFMIKKISCMNGLKTSCLNPFSIKPVWELAFWRAWQQQACGFLNVLAALMNHNSQSLWSHWGTSCCVIMSQIIMSTDADGSGGPRC